MIPTHIDYRARRLSQQPAPSTNPVLVPHLIRTVPSPAPSSSPQSPHPGQPHPTSQLAQHYQPIEAATTSQIRNQYQPGSQAGYPRNPQLASASHSAPGIPSHASATPAPSQNDWRRLRLHNLPPRMRSKSGAMRSPPSVTPTVSSGTAATVATASLNNGVTPSYSFSAEGYPDQFSALSIDSPHLDDQETTSMNSCSAVSSSDHQHRLARSPTTSTSSSFVSASSFIYTAPPLAPTQSQALALPPMNSVKTPSNGGPPTGGRPSRNLPPRLQRSAPDLRNRAQRQNQGPAATYSNLTHSRSIGHSSQSSHSNHQHTQVPPIPPVPQQHLPQHQQSQLLPHPQTQPGQRHPFPPSPTSTENGTDSGSADSHSLITPPPSTHTGLQSLNSAQGQTIYQSAATSKLSRKEKALQQQQQILQGQTAWPAGAKSISSVYSHASAGSGSASGFVSSNLSGRDAYSSSSLYGPQFVSSLSRSGSGSGSGHGSGHGHYLASGGSQQNTSLGYSQQAQYSHDQGSEENGAYHNFAAPGGMRRTRKESYSGLSAGHAGASGLGSVAEFEYEVESADDGHGEEYADDGHGGDDAYGDGRGDDDELRSVSTHHHEGIEYGSSLGHIPEDVVQEDQGYGVRDGLKRRGSYVPNPAFDPFSSVDGETHDDDNESLRGDTELGHGHHHDEEDEEELEVYDHNVHRMLGSLGREAELDVPLPNHDYQSRSRTLPRNLSSAVVHDQSPHPQLSSAGYHHQPWGLDDDSTEFDRSANPMSYSNASSNYPSYGHPHPSASLAPAPAGVTSLVPPMPMPSSKKNTHDIRALPPGAGASIPPSLSMFSSRPAMVGLPITTSTAFTAATPMRSPWS